jgi:hypothetical protein
MDWITAFFATKIYPNVKGAEVLNMAENAMF